MQHKITQVLMDANFLMIPYQFRIDILSEIARLVDRNYELVTLAEVVDELRKISGRDNFNRQKTGKEKKIKGRDRIAAGVALEIIESEGIRIINYKNENYTNTDDLILDYALEHSKSGEVVVCTNDKALKKRLVSENIRIIYMRKKNYLEMG